ncbi:unnamed protein product [Spirodela intermedia]|uniref:Uncharacterized protein n=1 Tax=Spirodela intermedia TaxID=51605 RepID=A0A7I8KIA9_SPIIN|nr:unnamed protein product [Spirodela intermedia]
MAHSKEEVTYGAAQAKISEDESLRVAYKHGTPLEGGKIAESEPVSLFSSAPGISPADPSPQPPLRKQDEEQTAAGMEAERPPEMATRREDSSSPSMIHEGELRGK